MKLYLLLRHLGKCFLIIKDRGKKNLANIWVERNNLSILSKWFSKETKHHCEVTELGFFTGIRPTHLWELLEKYVKGCCLCIWCWPWHRSGQQGQQSGMKVEYETKKTARTYWNTHLSLTSSIINSADDLQKLTPLTMKLHIPYLRTQRSWWRKSSGSLRCCRPSCCPTALKWANNRSATVGVAWSCAWCLGWTFRV